MKNWEEQLADLDSRLAVWRASYEREFKRLAKENGRSLFRRLSPELTEEVHVAAQKAAGEEIIDETSTFLAGLCDYYLSAGPQARALVRARMGNSNEVFPFLWQYAVQSPNQINSASDAGKLRLALAALSIDDHRAVTAQMLDAMGALWIAAVKAGIDPADHFYDVAEVSNPSTSGGAGRMQSYMSGFESSVYFRDNVKPQLAARTAG